MTHPIPIEYLDLTLLDVLTLHDPDFFRRTTHTAADVCAAVERFARSISATDARSHAHDRAWLADRFDDLSTEPETT